MEGAGEAGACALGAKVSSSCFWTACRAAAIGALLILLGSAMATVGFYSGRLSLVETVQGNITVLVRDARRDVHLASFTYLGPVVMGFGGFIILAACVMTCEARDTRIVPVLMRKGASQPRCRQPTPSSEASWDPLLLAAPPVTRVTKCPSEPNLAAVTSQPRGSLLSPRVHRGLAPPALPRQALSMDCPRPQQETIKLKSILKKDRSSESTSSMAMDLHLPQGGAVTLPVKDQTRATKPVEKQTTLPPPRPSILKESSKYLTTETIETPRASKRHPLVRQIALDNVS
ncbi:hypothetical protein LAZ67_14002618 [Cordylochernes scorpioides]|uniref:Transmembrane protein 200B n=1 Tax=Cordylochernes scorpioides TaxID=51811 RepID=A0ABY6LB60_9ARAC|nr:hypothetical protein LAZ67_14002618 [Cordylochernes scorpioides]